VLHLLNELRLSGAETLLSSAAPWFFKAGQSHEIVSLGAVLGDYEPVLRDAGYAVTHIPFAGSLAYARRLRGHMKASPAEVVHIHAERAFLMHGLIALSAGKRVVRSIHNTFEFEGRLRLVRGLERRLLAALGVSYIFCSQPTADNERARFGIGGKVVRNWIDNRRFKPRAPGAREAARAVLGIAPETFVVISVANWGPAKNQEAIVRAVRALSATSDILYLHCGDGAADLTARADVTEADPVRFIGPVRDVERYLAAADAFLSPSFFEGGPIALVEAAATGLPCVTTNVGIAVGMQGWPAVFFAKTSEASLIETIEAIRAVPAPELAPKTAALAERAGREFGAQQGAAGYMAVYDAALGR
jgi:glycosyltransferase involved in cell wall biosynthesis